MTDLSHRFGGHRLFTPAVACLIVIAVPLAQYYFRRFDNNPMYGWTLIYAIPHSYIFFLMLIPGALIAWTASRFSSPLPAPMILVAGCLLACIFLWSVPESHTVAARYVTQAKHLELFGLRYFFSEWGRGFQAWMDSPVGPLLYGLIFKVFGESRIYIQLFSAVLFAGTALLTYLIGKALWDEETGLYAGWLLLGMPYLLMQTPLMLIDVPTMFFLTLSIYLYIRALEAGGILRLATAVAAVFLASFSKYSVWPLFSILPFIAFIYYVYRNKQFPHRAVLQRSAAIIVTACALIVISVLLYYDVVSAQLRLLMDFQRPSLGRWTETFASIFLFQINPVISILAALSLVLAWWKRDSTYLIILWLPFLALFFQIKRVRYILPLLPLLALMAAYGLALFRDRQHRKVIVASVVVASLIVCYALYAPFIKQTSFVNLQDAGEFLNTLAVNSVDAHTVPQQNYPVNPAVFVPMLDLYAHAKIRYSYIPGASTPNEDYRTSRFRDSWEYQNPSYYTSQEAPIDGPGKIAVVVISDQPDDRLPPEAADAVSKLKNTRVFAVQHPIYANHSVVRVYW